MLFLLFGRGAVGVAVIFLLFERGGGKGGDVCFCCLGGGVFFILPFGRGTGVHSLTGLPALRGRRQKKKKTGKKTLISAKPQQVVATEIHSK